MIAIKANKQYTIDVKEKEKYLNNGFDIGEDNGKIIEYSHKKSVGYSEYIKVCEENGELKKQIKLLEKELVEIKKTKKK